MPLYRSQIIYYYYSGYNREWAPNTNKFEKFKIIRLFFSFTFRNEIWTISAHNQNKMKICSSNRDKNTKKNVSEVTYVQKKKVSANNAPFGKENWKNFA